MSEGQAAAYFIQTPNGNQGPYSHEAMQGAVNAGQLSPEARIWREGYADWRVLRESGEFSPPGGAQAAPAPTPAAPTGAAPAGLQPSQAQDDHLDSVFVAQVKSSWERYMKRDLSTHVDEVLLGGVITSTLDNGYSLIDITSNKANHYLRFENLEDGSRILFRMDHLAESLLYSEVLGHEASITIGYGERVRDFNKIWTALKQEAKGGFVKAPEPGVITVDGDVSSQYVYVEVGLIWDLNDYLDAESPYRILYPKLTEAIGSTVHALKKYLRGRFA